MDRLKASLQGITSTLAVFAEAELVRVVMPVVKFPRGELSYTSITVRIQHGMLLQNMDDIPPVYHIKVVPKSASGVGLPGAPLKGAL